MKIELTDMNKPVSFEFEGKVVIPDYEEAMLLIHTDDGRHLYSTLRVATRLLTPEVRAVFLEIQAMVAEMGRVAQ